MYVDDAYQRRGRGRALYLSLFEILRLQGYCTAVAIIVLSNSHSMALQETVGILVLSPCFRSAFTGIH